MKLYEILGIPRDADDATIKAGYRRAARAAHPDRQGGKTDLMQEVNHARDVLSDPERRKRYDQTGDDKPATSADVMARNALVSCFNHVIATTDGNWVQAARDVLTQHRSELRQQQAQLEEKRQRLLRQSGRFSCAEGENLLQSSIDAVLRDIPVQHGKLVQMIEAVSGALKMLEAYKSDEDLMQGMSIFLQFGSSTTTTGGWR